MHYYYNHSDNNYIRLLVLKLSIIASSPFSHSVFSNLSLPISSASLQSNHWREGKCIDERCCPHTVKLARPTRRPLHPSSFGARVAPGRRARRAKKNDTRNSIVAIFRVVQRGSVHRIGGAQRAWLRCIDEREASRAESEERENRSVFHLAALQLKEKGKESE